MANPMGSLASIGQDPEMAKRIMQALIESTRGGSAPTQMPSLPAPRQATIQAPGNSFLERLMRGEEMPFDIGGTIKSGISLSKAPVFSGLSMAAGKFVDKIAGLLNSGQSHRVGFTFASKFLDEVPVAVADLPKIEAALRPALKPKQWEMIKTALDSKVSLREGNQALRARDATRPNRGLARKAPPPSRQEGPSGAAGLFTDFIP